MAPLPREGETEVVNRLVKDADKRVKTKEREY
jgi:hypothetical protein